MVDSSSDNRIGVAVLDTGITPHIDFDNRIVAFKDCISNRASAYDDNGHGTHIAGIIAGSGRDSNGRIRGVAPRANLIAVKILNKNGSGSSLDARAGMQWILENQRKYNIRIVNISLEMPVLIEEGREKQFIIAVEELWSAGIVVVAATGNNGPKSGTVSAPGSSRKIITVGAYDKMKVVSDRGVRTYYSGTGPTKECIMKPEVVAKGNGIYSCRNAYHGYQRRSGTSMAAPYVTGMIARLLEKYPDMTPKEVKLRIHDRAISLGLPKSTQGWGIIDERFLL